MSCVGGAGGCVPVMLDMLGKLVLNLQDALNFACHHALWGHALMLASTMEEQSHHYVVNRFTASLLSSDPLNTFYTLVLGRMPTVTKVRCAMDAITTVLYLLMCVSMGGTDYCDAVVVLYSLMDWQEEETGSPTFL